MSCVKVKSSKDYTNSSVISISKNPPCCYIMKLIIRFIKLIMLQEWGLILSVTSVSLTMLMIISTYFAILPQAQQYYQQSRTMVLLLTNSFNIFYILISPLIFNFINKYYVSGVLISTLATGIAAVGRYLAGQNYTICLLMTIIISIAHIPIITAPYGLLKLFPQNQKAYAASIPLFLPILGVNFCILYGMAFIAIDNPSNTSIQANHIQITKLNGIIGIIGVFSMIFTILLLLRLKKRIEAVQIKKQVQMKNVDQESVSSSTVTQTEEIQQQNLTDLKASLKIFWSNKRIAAILIAWGSIVGVNWAYGSLFGIIFEGQNLTEKQIALIGLAANISSALFSNLGSYIKNNTKLQNNTIIEFLNIFGFVAAVIIQLSRHVQIFQNLFFLIFVIIVLRAGFSSFVSLAFVEMEKEQMNSMVISGYFFWVANVTDLLGMELVDLVPPDISLFVLSGIVFLCIICVRKINKEECLKI